MTKEIDKKMYKEKFPSMVDKGEIDLGEKKKKNIKNPMAEDRATEGKKDKYKKMGFGKMMASGEIKFANGGRIGRKLGGGTKGGGTSDTQVKKKFKNLGNLPESIQIKIAGKKIAKKV